VSKYDEPLLQESAPVEQPKSEPDYKVLYEQEKKEREDFQQQMREKEAAFTARMDTLERVAKGPREMYAPAPEAPTKEWTNEEIMTDPKAAMSAIFRDGIGALNKQYAQLLSSVVEDAFDTKLHMLDNKRFGGYLKPFIQRYFDQNPGLKIQKGSLDQVYKNFVADHIDELLEMERKGKEVEPEVERKRVPSRTSPPVAPRSPARLAETEPEEDLAISKADRKIMDKFARLGVTISEAEWAAIRDGRLLAPTEREDE